MDTSVTDPLGRTITLHDRTWFGHVLRGHPEVTDHRHLVEATIARPVVIRRSNADPDCRLYFGMGPRPDLMIVVVADLKLGLVKTAHLAKRISGGPVEWS